MHQHRIPRLLAWSAAALLALTACSGGADEAGPPAPGTATQTAPGPLPSGPESLGGTAQSTSTPGGSEDAGTGDEGGVGSTDQGRPSESVAAGSTDAGRPTQGDAASTGAEPGQAAAALVPQVQVRDSAGGEVVQTFSNPTAAGVPLTFMVVATQGDWMQVQLPVRPNGSTGWVRADDVEGFTVPYLLRVSTQANTVELYEDGALVETFDAATGTGDTPTPRGRYYLTELIAPTNAGYGPFAYGISAYSDVLNEFGGGPGQIGLHGTDDAASIGRAASHGCIRLSNSDITLLSEILPLGTPIEIT